MQRTGHDEAEICRLCDRNAGYISQLKSRNKKNGEDIPQKFIDLLKLRFAIKGKEQPKSSKGLNNLIDQNIELIIAHKEVAIAHKELAIANKELAEANKELTIMLKNSISSNGQNNHQNLAEKVLHRIAEKGVPALWASKEAGMKILNNYLIGAPEDIAVTDNQAKADKSSIS
jgi:hypothetical protein